MGDTPPDLDDLLDEESEIQSALPNLGAAQPPPSPDSEPGSAGHTSKSSRPAVTSWKAPHGQPVYPKDAQPSGSSETKVTEAVEPDLDSLLAEEEELLGGVSSASSVQRSKPTKSKVEKKSYACEACGRMTVSNSLLKEFKVKVCYDCKKSREEYKMMSKATAKSQFLLSDKDLSKLDSITVKNPRRNGWTDMRLYITFQLHAKCIEKYGSLQAMEKEKLGRAEQRIQKREKSAQDNIEAATSLLKNIKHLRSEVALSKSETSPSPKRSAPGKGAEKNKKRRKKEPKYIKRYHTHTFGQSTQKTGNIWVKTCTECNFELEFEQL